MVFGEKRVGIGEIIVLLVVALIVIPPEKLPDVMRGAGKAMRELRRASNLVMHELSSVLEPPPPRRTSPAAPPAPATRAAPAPANPAAPGAATEAATAADPAPADSTANPQV